MFFQAGTQHGLSCLKRQGAQSPRNLGLLERSSPEPLSLGPSTWAASEQSRKRAPTGPQRGIRSSSPLTPQKLEAARHRLMSLSQVPGAEELMSVASEKGLSPSSLSCFKSSDRQRALQTQQGRRRLSCPCPSSKNGSSSYSLTAFQSLQLWSSPFMPQPSLSSQPPRRVRRVLGLSDLIQQRHHPSNRPKLLPQP